MFKNGIIFGWNEARPLSKMLRCDFMIGSFKKLQPRTFEKEKLFLIDFFFKSH